MSLNREEIFFAVNGFLDGSVADYQMSALLMAVCINSMNDEETYHLTDAMIKSGEILDLSSLGNSTVDKHSTGGVGDKTTLITAPIVASLGCTVAKMSGRGLGFTGGTIDKLESVKGFKTELTTCEFLEQSKKIGICVAAQSGEMVPADKKLYALRDVSATIDSIPLIASSIMSKKIASGARSIVLDVKFGSGAFMKTIDDALKLANTMIKLGKAFHKNVCALITNMDIPLGYCVGNSLELYEAIQVLKGKGEKRLTELCLSIAAQMVSLGLGISKEKSIEMVNESIYSGNALCKLNEWIKTQGGTFTNENELLAANSKIDYLANADGYISKIDAEGVGISAMLLGAGRIKKEDKIDHRVGLFFEKSLGDYVTKGQKIATLYVNDDNAKHSCLDMLDKSIFITAEKPEIAPLIFRVIS